MIAGVINRVTGSSPGPSYEPASSVLEGSFGVDDGLGIPGESGGLGVDVGIVQHDDGDMLGGVDTSMYHQPTRKRRIIKLLVCSVALAGVMAFFGVLGAAVSYRKKSSMSHNEQGPAIAEGVHAPTDLAATCSESNVKNTTTGRSKCADACEVASCCHDLDQSENCYDELEGLCQEFEPCKILQGGGEWPGGYKKPTTNGASDEGMPPGSTKFVPVAPADLEDSCASGDKLGDCIDACVDAECCWNPHINDNCYAWNRMVCIDYAACVRVNGGKRPGAPNTDVNELESEHRPTVSHVVHELCNGEDKNMVDCMEACAPAQCCQDVGEDSCVEEAWCEYYSSCQVLYEEGNAAALVNSVCNSRRIQTKVGMEECREVCDHRACCFYPDGKDCVDGNEDWCAEFKVCAPIMEVALEDTDGEEEEDVNVACTEDNLASPGGRDKCVAACDDRACCFFPTNGCRDTNQEWCAAYDICKPIMDEVLKDVDFGDTDDTDSDDDDDDDDSDDQDRDEEDLAAKIACAADKIQTDDGWKNCKSVCMSRACCFTNSLEFSCYTSENKDWCDAFDICEPFLTSTDEGDSLPPAGDGGGLTYSKEEVAEYCKLENIKTDQGFDTCYSICELRECCFYESSVGCQADNSAWCDEWSPCIPIMKDAKSSDTIESSDDGSNTYFNGEYSTNELQALCSSENIQTDAGYNKCFSVCEARECCFLDPNIGCQENNPEWCQAYEACRPLFSDDDNDGEDDSDDQDVVQVVYSSDEVKEYCAFDNIKTEEGFDKCYSICFVRKCCFVDGDTGCYDEKQDWCDEYEACRPMMTDQVDSFSDDEDDLQYDESDDDEDFDDDDDEDFDDDDDEEDIKAVLEELCDPAKVATEDGRLDCISKCDERVCCFYEAEESCLYSNWEWCDEYKPCRDVMRDELENLKYSENDWDDSDSDEDDDDDEREPSRADEVCTDDAINTEEGLHQCKLVCKTRSCCFVSPNDRDYCGDINQQWCGEFEVCKPIMEDDDSIDDDVLDSMTVEEACDEEFVKTSVGRNTCISKCDDRACCFFSSKESCLVENWDWCDEYIACREVMTEELKDIEVESETIETLTYGSFSSDSDESYGVSFDSESYDDDVDINELCAEDNTATPTGLAQCRHQCEARLCCFYKVGENCVADNQAWCSEYNACIPYMTEDVIYDANPDVGKSDEDIINEKCSAVNVATADGKADCISACEARECCFFEREFNCEIDLGEWCDEYRVCKPFMAQDSGV